MKEDFNNVREALLKRGYQVSVFSTAGEAVEYLDEKIDGTSVSFGGSMTLEELGLPERLAAHNTIRHLWRKVKGRVISVPLKNEKKSEVYLLSANALSETGEIINIDGAANRVSNELYGHKKVYFVIGRNKLEPDYERALWHARNIAAPKNAKRLEVKTPCSVDGRCHDCSSPQRICRALVVLWERVSACEMEVILIDEDLGF